MTRPQIIRADTIDLQDPENPSAKDHSRQPARPSPLSNTSLAPHQNQEIRKIEDDAADVPPSPRHPERLHDGQNVNLYDDSDDDEDDFGNHLQHDISAGQLNGRTTHEDDDMDDDEDDMDDDMMDKISSSPSIDDEDIDFEFVYALHTFVATVEGQANATKGDTMFLLDDSNSYWWLVRVVKDGSIGYLPAEHIETPTERLARLNKHRNIDLSATMLGDNHEKSKNPLKKAMRRRNAKTVQFTAPTYFEPSDNEYSSEEDEDEMDQVDHYQQENSAQQAEVVQEPQHEEETTATDVVEPLNIRAGNAAVQTQAAAEPESAEPKTSIDRSRSSEDGERQESRSRNGTVRNTDSFFKDDNVETKKISLTPNLLRDDSSNSLNDRELATRGSSESFEKALAAVGKEDKKRKEKKGMLSGLFKRKDKKGKGQDEGDEEEKASMEVSRSSPQPKESYDSTSNEVKPKLQARPAAQTPTRASSKLQKSPPQQVSPTKKDSQVAAARPDNLRKDSGMQQSIAEEDEPSEPAVTRATVVVPNLKIQTQQPEPAREQISEPTQVQNDGPPQQQQQQPTFQQLETQATTQFEPASEQSREMSPDKLTATRGSFDDSPIEGSPVFSQQHTPTTAATTYNNESSPPDLIRDSSSVGEPGDVSISPSSSPDILGASGHKSANATPTTTTSSSTSTSHHSPSVWSSADLRAYMDDGTDIRDLMMIVHDVSHVTPAPMDHPLLVDLFQDQRRRLEEMQERLDRMMVDFWDKRSVKNAGGGNVEESGASQVDHSRASSDAGGSAFP